MIIGPGGFASPISLAISGDTYNTLSLTSTSVTSPGQVVSLGYSGGTNIGSTITASTTGASNASATFAGTGASMTYFGFSDSTDGFAYPDTYAVQPLPGTSPTVAVLMGQSVCCSGLNNGLIAIANPSGVQKVYAGDVTDPFNTPAPGSLTYTNVKVVHGMSEQLQTWTGNEVTKEIAVSSSGNVYYAGAISTYGDTTNCSGTLETTGTIGLLNPTSGALVQPEKIVKGNPAYMQLDPAGNLWFIERTGQCNASDFFASGWALGELSASGTLTESDFGSVGLSGVVPDSMQLSNDGVSMYIGDDNSGNLLQLTLNSSVVQAATLTSAAYPFAIVVAPSPNNTVAWAGDEEPGEYYSYGWLNGGSITGTVNEAQFPTAGFNSYGGTYADNSFWFGSDEWGNGLARISGWSNGKPLTTQYPMMFGDDNPYVTGIAAANGYIWAGDSDEGYIIAMQYGAQPSGGTITLATHRLGAARTVRNANPGPHHRQAQHTKR